MPVHALGHTFSNVMMYNFVSCMYETFGDRNVIKKLTGLPVKLINFYPGIDHGLRRGIKFVGRSFNSEGHFLAVGSAYSNDTIVRESVDLGQQVLGNHGMCQTHALLNWFDMPQFSYGTQMVKPLDRRASNVVAGNLFVALQFWISVFDASIFEVFIAAMMRQYDKNFETIQDLFDFGSFEVVDIVEILTELKFLYTRNRHLFMEIMYQN